MRKILLLLFAVAIWSNTLTAQSYIKTIEVKDTVQFNGSKFLLQCHLEVPEGKEVQELLSQAIFCEQGKTVQEAFDSFINLWKIDKNELPSRIKGHITINLRKDYELEGHFSCFHLEFSKTGNVSTDIVQEPDINIFRKKRTQYKSFEKGLDYRFIYDINRHQMVGVNEIFQPVISEKIHEVFGQNINLYAEDRCLQLVSAKGDGTFIFSEKSENNFSDYFKQLVGWGKQADHDTPEYLHGHKGLIEYFDSNNYYIDSDSDSIIVSATIAADGSIHNLQIKHIPDGYDKDILMTLCRKMHQWLPAYQNGEPISKDVSFVLKAIEEENFSIVEQNPEFPGGLEALMKWLRANLVYPPKARKNGIQGKVLVQFVVDKRGSIIEPEIFRSVDPELDAEALRVVSIMPKWQPGRQKGKPVRVRFTLPVTFRLYNEKK